MAKKTIKLDVGADEVPLIQNNLEYTAGIAIVAYKVTSHDTRWLVEVTLSYGPAAALYSLGKYVGLDIERSQSNG